jgi:hypothetical protein
MMVNDELAFSSVFDISTVNPTGGASRSWPNTAKTGDYAKGAFYFNSSTNELRYFVPWLEINSSGTTELHSKIFGRGR